MFGYKTTISGGFSAFLVMGFIIGVIPTGVVFAMEHSGIHSYIAIAKCLRHFFTLLCPQFSLSYLCLRFSQKLVENFNWKYMEEDKRKHTCESNPNPCCYGKLLRFIFKFMKKIFLTCIITLSVCSTAARTGYLFHFYY